MKRMVVAVVGLALVVAVLGTHGSSIRAQPTASIALPPPRATVQLYAGCNNIALSFPNGTASETVVQAVTPAGTVQAMWRHNAALARFEGFSPAAPQASDLLTVNLWDAVWLCVAGASSPSPPPPPPPIHESGPARIDVSLEGGAVFGDHWPAEANLIATADDPETVEAPDIAVTLTTDAGGNFMYQGFPGRWPGWFITVTDGEITKTHTVRDI